MIGRLIAGGLALLAAGTVAASSLAEFAALRAPASVTGVWGSSATAWTGLATIYTSDTSEQGSKAAQTAARNALLASPSQVIALRVLGQIAARQADAASAEQYFNAAVARSRRDTPSQLWRYFRALETGRTADAVEIADTLLRRRPTLGNMILPPMAEGVRNDPAVAELVAARLGSKPGWLEQFMTAFGLLVRSRADFEGFESKLDNHGVAVSWTSRASIISGLFNRGLHADAYAIWQDGSADAIRADNLAFGQLDRPQPTIFDWRTRSSAITQVRALSGASGNDQRMTVTHASLEGSGDAVAERYLVLAPGSYALTIGFRSDMGSSSLAPFRWTVQCTPQAALAAPTASVSPGKDTGTGQVKIDFKVPKAGCTAVRLLLVVDGREVSRPVTAEFAMPELTPLQLN